MPTELEKPTQPSQPSRSTGLTTRGAVLVALLFAYSLSDASDCSPGSPIYEDAFFAYCDAARATEEIVAPSRDQPQDDAASQVSRGEATEPRGEAAPERQETQL